MAAAAAAAAAALALLPPLPTIAGPKLEAFTEDIENHDYTLLEYLGSGVHSAVFRVQIDNNTFVVKFFKTYWLDVPTFEMYPFDEHYMMDQTQNFDPNVDDPQPQAVMDALRDQTTPFYNECRVYGRLKELGREDLAIKSHGYLRVYLTTKFQQQWDDAIKLFHPNSPAGQHRCELLRLLEHPDMSVPVYAIVKDWIQDHRTDGIPPTNQEKARQIKHIPKMLRNLHNLHKCGIVVRDLKEQQYYDGQIGDFSHAWTVPHLLAPGNGIRPDWAWKSMAAWDLHCFQRDIINQWTRTALSSHPPLKPPTVTAWRNGQHRYGLRSRDVVQGPQLPLLKYDDTNDFEMNYDPPFDPSSFNWKALEARKAAQAVVAGRVGKRRATGQAPKAKGVKKIKLKVNPTRPRP
ncbi:hypothetical protein FPOA_02418 [Fusarium poae]|uniref:Protein kinase domain-containing protein n=1 Tax=Fusarium poae TaxID=36050 RepID=A0A1B8B6Y2_FUSPO|nr:hypothetical protein FPOA_02418 [Fusarium poae]